MTIYKYVVSSHPDNWDEGHVFDNPADAREFMAQYGDHGAVLTEVVLRMTRPMLIWDTRPSAANR